MHRSVWKCLYLCIYMYYVPLFKGKVPRIALNVQMCVETVVCIRQTYGFTYIFQSHSPYCYIFIHLSLCTVKIGITIKYTVKIKEGLCFSISPFSGSWVISISRLDKFCMILKYKPLHIQKNKT